MSGEMMLFPDTVDEFMEQYKLVDEDHVYSNGIAFVPVFRMKQWFEHLQAFPITNADRIRAMTDEELANILDGSICPPGYNEIGACEADEQICKSCWLDWLKQEADDDL